MSSTQSWKPRGTSRSRGLAALLLAAALCVRLPARASVEVLTPVGGLPPNLVGQLREPAAFVETEDKRYLVLDQRAQTVLSVDAAKAQLTKLIAIGPSDGEILRPLSFAVGAERTLLILDNPGGYERVQTFYDTGTPLTVFRRFPAAGDVPRINVNSMLSSGLGALAAIGRNVLTQMPDGAALMSEVTTTGEITRQIGLLRPTGHETDVPLHRALNAGLPLVASDGSIYFVFTAGVPIFRKYSSSGALVFERHIEGPELDATVQSLPTAWPKRTVEGREFPNVAATVRTAAVDADGGLWISLVEPFTYVYDSDGNKTRTVQFRGAGVLSPTSLFFAKNGRLLVTPGCYEYDAR